MNFDHTQLLMADDFTLRHLEKVRIVQLKMNGLRLLVTRRQGQIRAVTREGKTDFWPDLQKVPNIREKVEVLPLDTALDCEIHVPGIPETSMKTFLKAGDQRLTLSPFAVPYFDGVDMRDEAWFSIAKLITTLGFTPPETVVGEFNSGDVARLLADATSRSIEGWVLKAAHYRGWYKLKPVKTVDCIVKHVIPGEGKHCGRMGALLVGFADSDWATSVGTGFTDLERIHVWQNREGTVGKVIEVVYDSLAANGALKFPRFKRFRDDKEAVKCVMKQIQP